MKKITVNLPTTLALIFVLSFCTMGQLKRSKDLRLSITTERASVCFNDTTRVVAKLTNVGSVSLVVNPSRIGGDPVFSYQTTGPDGSTKIRTLIFSSHGSSDENEDAVVLRPGESLARTRVFDLNQEFFARTENFSLEISYVNLFGGKYNSFPIWKGRLSSNKLKYAIKQCTEGRIDEVNNRGSIVRVFWGADFFTKPRIDIMSLSEPTLR